MARRGGTASRYPSGEHHHGQVHFERHQLLNECSVKLSPSVAIGHRGAVKRQTRNLVMLWLSSTPCATTGFIRKFKKVLRSCGNLSHTKMMRRRGDKNLAADFEMVLVKVVIFLSHHTQTHVSHPPSPPPPLSPQSASAERKEPD